MSAATEALGVVVLAYGSGGEYAPLIESLLAEGVEPGAILVVHNPAEPAEAPPPVPRGCELIQADRNLGYAGGMNLGIARMLERGVDLLLLLTHDARLRRGAVEALLSAARQKPRYGVIGPALVHTGTEIPYSFGGVTRATGANGHIDELPPAVPGGLLDCDWVDGGTMLVRGDVLRRVGAFDEGFWGYCEEADLCLRVRRAGFLVGVAVTARADQDPGGPKRPGAWAYLLTRNGMEYARRAVGVRGVFAIASRAAWLVAFELLRVVARSVRGRPGGIGEPWATAVGTARGALDYFRGRWGPPPSDLPGMGDVSNA